MIGGLLALLDDMAYFAGNLANTVAANSRQVVDAATLATKKASGIITDDTAVVATGVIGIAQERETTVIAKIAAGSFFGNKLFLAIIMLTIDMVWPPASTILLLLGGAYLAYEATHEGLHKFHLVRHDAHTENAPESASFLDRAAARSPLLRRFLGNDSEGKIVTDMLTKDLVLSAEITILTMGVIANAGLGTKIILLGLVGFATTGLVYGVVWAIARADNLALHLMADTGTTKHAAWKRHIGTRLIAALPHVLRALSYIGTLAMLVVGGQIIAHKIPWLHDVPSLIAGIGTGLAVGLTLIGLIALYKRLFVRH